MTITLEFYNFVALLVVVAFVCFLAGLTVEGRRGAVPPGSYGGGAERFSATSEGVGCSWFFVLFGVGGLLLMMFMSGL